MPPEYLNTVVVSQSTIISNNVGHISQRSSFLLLYACAKAPSFKYVLTMEWLWKLLKDLLLNIQYVKDWNEVSTWEARILASISTWQRREMQEPETSVAGTESRPYSPLCEAILLPQTTAWGSWWCPLHSSHDYISRQANCCYSWVWFSVVKLYIYRFTWIFNFYCYHI